MDKFKPYIWLRKLNAAESILKFEVTLDDNYTLDNEMDNPNDIGTKYNAYRIKEYRVTYKFNARSPIKRQINFTSANGFVYTDTDKMMVKIYDTMGNQKGKGTVLHGEADDSGGEDE